MNLVFRKIDAGAAAPGELLLMPRDPALQDRRDLARLALEQPPSAFVVGEGATERIVLRPQATFDDLLAAEVVAAKLAGEPLPKGLAAFAEYAAISREGLRPGEVPLEVSLDGVFHAIKNEGDGELANPSTAARFCTYWGQLKASIWTAAEANVSPFTEPFLAEDPLFARQRAFLKRDHDVYLQDVRRGERWRVRIPGHDAESSALILFEPKSLLTKYWARQDKHAPVGGEYLLLGVRWGKSDWVFSTDPVHRLPIRSLCEALQREEPGAAWFDGAAFQHTLIGAPKGGTKLDDAKVLAAARRWCGAKVVRDWTPARRLTATVGTVAAAAILVVGTWVLRPALDSKSGLVPRSEFEVQGPIARGEPLTEAQKEEVRLRALDVPGYALLICVSKSPVGALPVTCKDTTLLRKALVTRYGYLPENVIVLGDSGDELLDENGARLAVKPPTLDNMREALAELGARIEDFSSKNPKTPTQMVFYYAGHGATIPVRDEAAASSLNVGYLVLQGYGEHRQDRLFPADRWGYDMGQILRDFQLKVPATHRLILIDSCFSGLALTSRGKTVPDDHVYELWQKGALVLLAAATDQQLSWEDRNSAMFTGSVLDAIGAGESRQLAADSNKDGIVTDTELSAYVETQVPQRLRTAQEDGDHSVTQTPMTLRAKPNELTGQFLFIPRKKTPPATATAPSP